LWVVRNTRMATAFYAQNQATLASASSTDAG
jgi:hypothetical protein